MLRFKTFENKDHNLLKLLTTELQNIENSHEFKIWLEALGTPLTDTITKEQLISGYCEDLAFYLHYKYGAPIYGAGNNTIKDGHYFVKLGEKFYDAMHSEGFSKISESEWAQRLLQRRTDLTAQMIDASTFIFDEKPWDVYIAAKPVVKPVY